MVLKAPLWGSAGHAEELGFGDWCLPLHSALYSAQVWHSSLLRYKVLKHGCGS